MPQDDLLGVQLDEYRLEMLLGRGGMARVYRGLDTRLGRYVAIKVIDAPFRTDSEHTMRFEREAQAIAKLEHPHIVRLYRYGEAQGVLYMAMQYIEGSDLGFLLRSYHADHEFIEPEEALRITSEVCSALDYAHSKGVIHRDVKPSNIMLDQQGHAYLTDFGLALLTEVGTRGEIFGSPHYIAPEQAISSAGAVPQSDLYAMGIILYEMFTGKLPFDAETPLDIAMKHMSDPPPPPHDIRADVAPELEAVILKALAKEPAQRYPTGATLIDAMEHALAQSRTPAPTLTAATLPHKSIPDRVAIDVAANPLPPIPADAATPRFVPLPSSISAPPLAVTEPTMTRRSYVPIYAGTLAVALLAMVAVALVLLLGRGKGDDASPALSPSNDGTQLDAASDMTATAPFATSVTQVAALAATSTPLILGAPPLAVTASPVPTLTALAPPNTLIPTATKFPTLPPTAMSTFTPTWTPLPTLTSAPTLTPVPPTAIAQAPVVAEANYSLLIAKRGEDSLFVVNQGNSGIPLDALVLGAGDGRISGSEWGVPTLMPGECVAAWKDNGNPKSPDVTCTEVGQRVTREKPERFWKSAFDIYINGALVANCNGNQCTIDISSATPDMMTTRANNFELLIAKKGEDSLFVINQGTSGFPLSALRLGEGQGAISGVEWGVDVLLPGQCVAAWKDNGKPKSPDVDCDMVGANLTRGKADRFWKSSFAVFYGEQAVLTCGSDRCTMIVSE